MSRCTEPLELSLINKCQMFQTHRVERKLELDEEIFHMVRCSIKRTIKSLICLSLLGIFCHVLLFSSHQSERNEIVKKEKSPKIFIVSSRPSKAIRRLVLFFNELRFSDVKLLEIDGNFNYQTIVDFPSILVLDRPPNRNLSIFIEQHRISLFIYLTEQCEHCIDIKYSQMLLERIDYPTMNFHRTDLKPVIHQTASPFQIEPTNELITLLRFERVLPYFHQRLTVDDRCFGLRIDSSTRFNTVLFVRDRITFEKIFLLVISPKQVQLSSCLDRHWFIWPLMMDILKHLTSGSYDHYGFHRHIQIDIDDIFLGHKSNDHFTSDDIRSLLSSQEFIQSYVPNFRYRLGFSGHFFKANGGPEYDGDRLLIENKEKFFWFHHTWKHEKLTHYNHAISLISSTESNLKFAQKYNLPLDRDYAVAPHHTGIYPINPLVYRIWHQIFNFSVTSTENYPYHYNAPSNRRGFIYRGLSVLPRQSCGLYTTTRNYTTFPGGSDHLEQYLLGGRLFRRILTNPISIFMSHNVNYGHDRLGNYVFSKLVYLISTWTRLKFADDSPTSHLAREYFDHHYPEEQMPVFTNPCDDQVLLDLWTGNRSMCRSFPQFLIVGPQKTGTTALHAMLRQHPDLCASKPSSATYEEVQFFSNDTLYLNGIDWYLNQFNLSSDRAVGSMNFEKSATYFDSNVAIKRIKALLPEIRLIFILTEPGARAYSRYQHEIARTNLSISFDDLLEKNHDQNSQESHVRQRCLQPGHYAHYLQQWFEHFPSERISIIDGEEFRRDPRQILNDLQQSFLQLNHSIDASQLIRYNKKKGFFCPISDTNEFQCLGNSKGRRYEAMSSWAREYLHNYYFSSNEKLIELLRTKNFSLPSWLSD